MTNSHESESMFLNISERVELRDFLIQRFSLDDLLDIAFDIGVSGDALPHDRINQLARELISHCERKFLTNCLLEAILRRQQNERIVRFLAKYGNCISTRKVQIVMPIDVLPVSIEDFKIGIAQLCNGIHPDQVELIAVAKGSIKVLISLPIVAAIKLCEIDVFEIDLLETPISTIQFFDNLDPHIQKSWRQIYPQRSNLTLLLQSSASTATTNAWQDMTEAFWDVLNTYMEHKSGTREVVSVIYRVQEFFPEMFDLKSSAFLIGFESAYPYQILLKLRNPNKLANDLPQGMRLLIEQNPKKPDEILLKMSAQKWGTDRTTTEIRPPNSTQVQHRVDTHIGQTRNP